MKIFETGSFMWCSSSMRDRSLILWAYSARFGVPQPFREPTPAFSNRFGSIRTHRVKFSTGTHHEYKSERATVNTPRLSNLQLRAAVSASFLEPEPANSKA